MSAGFRNRQQSGGTQGCSGCPDEVYCLMPARGAGSPAARGTRRTDTVAGPACLTRSSRMPHEREQPSGPIDPAELADLVAHEVNNLLNGIGLHAALLEQSVPPQANAPGQPGVA